MTKLFFLLFTIATVLFPFLPAHSESFPNKPISIITGSAAGSGQDAIIRSFVKFAEEETKYEYIVVNKPGAGNLIASRYMALEAKPDGYQIYITSGNSSLSQAPLLYKDLGYDPLTSFTPIATLLSGTFNIAVPANSKIESVEELTQKLKSMKEIPLYAYTNSFGQMASEVYLSRIGVTGRAVAYKDPSNLINDFNGPNNLEFIFHDNGFMLGRPETFRPLAVTSATRFPLQPDLKTMQEHGVKNFDMSAWFVVLAPKNTPKDIVNKLENIVEVTSKSQAWNESLKRFYQVPWVVKGKELQTFMIKDAQYWKEVAKTANIEPE